MAGKRAKASICSFTEGHELLEEEQSVRQTSFDSGEKATMKPSLMHHLLLYDLH